MGRQLRLFRRRSEGAIGKATTAGPLGRANGVLCIIQSCVARICLVEPAQPKLRISLKCLLKPIDARNLMNTIAVCFVCLGNICRSPSAEAVMLHQVGRARLSDKIVVDSAGTGDWHIGQPPDDRAQSAARKRGYDLSPLRAGRSATKISPASICLSRWTTQTPPH